MSADNRASSSGVRNLRAMFENQSAANSPEPRGRSPAGSATSNSDINRPTSKVRASFVSVETSGGSAVKDFGTTKGTAEGANNLNANRRESFSINQEDGVEVLSELKQIVSGEKEKRETDPAVVESIPEEAVDSRPSSRPPPPIRNTTIDRMPNLGSIMKGSDFPEAMAVEEQKPEEGVPEAQPAAAEAEAAIKPIEEAMAALSIGTPRDNPDKAISGVQDTDAALKPADPKDEATISGRGALPPSAEVLPSTMSQQPPQETPESVTTQGTPSASSESPDAKTNDSPITASPTKTAAKKPAAISTTKPTPGKAAPARSPLPKSPAPTRVPRTPTKAASASFPTKPSASASRVADKPPTKAQAAKTSRSSLKPSTTSTSNTAMTRKEAPTEGKKDSVKPTAASKETKRTSDVPFRKPKPKSPTRPVRLPSHLLAPTAASVAKHSDETAQPVTRKPSTVSRPPPTKTAPPPRKAASRASVAPQPAKRPDSRASTRGTPDDSFLARMMRPTAASASKTHEKVSSPPRKTTSLRAPAKPKSTTEKVVAKGKQKVDEAVAKVKDAVTTNGISDEKGMKAEEHEEHPAAPDTEKETVTGASAAPAEAEREEPRTPDQAESSGVDVLQTPNFNEQTIR